MEGREDYGTIYFLYSPQTFQVKIGFSKNFPNRLKDLRQASPVRLVVLKTVKGKYVVEQSLQCIFSQYCTKGEWFTASPQLLSFICRLVRGRELTYRKIKFLLK